MPLEFPPDDQRVKCSTASMWLDPRGFIVVDQVPRALQTWDTAAEMMDAAKTLKPPEMDKAPMLVLSNESRTDRSGRQGFAELGMGNACVALVVKSKVSEVTGNFFLRINKPGYPMKLFGEVEDAIEWVMTFVPKPE